MVPSRSILWPLLLVASVLASLASCADEGGDGSADTDVVDAVAADASADGDVDTSLGDPGEFTVVDIDPETPPTVQLAVQASAGLHNRERGGSVYTRADDSDRRWLEELGLEPTEIIDADAFVGRCVARFPSCVRYSYSTQQELLPSILTIGAALGAVPLDVGMSVGCDDVAFDATLELAERNTPYLATRYAFENHVDETTGLAMLNPGYDQNADDLANPALSGEMSAALVDFVFSERLFVVFLVNGCQGPSQENELLSDIVNSGHWPTPLGVYGYNNSWLVAGYLFEAQTRCLDSRNMGAIPTETPNLSFFSTRREPITDAGQLEQNALATIDYDPEKTYVAFVIGDGDNVRYIMSTRNVWLRQRLDDCARADNACEPITWSISPHLPQIAPDVLEWYFEASHQTGNDYFTLPPSGHLYAYPSSMGEGDQERFAAATEQSARILGVGSTVHWDWWETWPQAESEFLPRYARQEGAIRGVFPINVPYMFPAFTWWDSDSFFRVVVGEDGGETVVFRPRQWRGIDESGSGVTEAFFLSPENMAEELSNYPPGTVTWVYMTSDGGLSLENSFMELVGLLPEHVQLVSADTAARLALEAFHRDGGEE